MHEQLQTPPTTVTSAILTHTTTTYNDHMDTSSTPYVSAPSSPGRSPPSNGYYYYSAPASPMHFLLSTTQHETQFSTEISHSARFDDFDFSAITNAGGKKLSGTMSSADELFFNGQIRPMKLAPLLDGDENGEEFEDEGEIGIPKIDVKFRNKSLRRRNRSMSPMSEVAMFDWQEDEIVSDSDVVDVHGEETENRESNEKEGEIGEYAKVTETMAYGSGTSSKLPSIGRSSKRWVLLKEFLYRSRSEGSNKNGRKFWGTLSFSPIVKDKKLGKLEKFEENLQIPKVKGASSLSNQVNDNGSSEQMKKKRINGVMGKRRMSTMPSAHEMHYTTNRAQAVEMRRKTFLPYRQGLLGCLGFSSRSHGAWNGFTKAMNPVSSR